MPYPNTIDDIIEWDYSNPILNVKAYIPDVVQTHPQTLYDPPEYGPGLAQVTVFLDDDLDSAPPSSLESSAEVLELLKEYDPISWRFLDED